MNLTIWLLTTLALPAWAGRLDRQPSANASDIPALAKLLKQTGWEPTPELTANFHPGDIFVPNKLGGHELVSGACVEAEPRESAYTAVELVTQLQAGVSTPFASSRGELVKKLKFSTPVQAAIPTFELTPTATCVAQIRKAAEGGKATVGDWYIVKEVLKARIDEQTCGRLDAKGNFGPLSQADASLALACSQASLDPVAVGYRTQPVREWLDDAGISLDIPQPSPPTPPDAVVVSQPTKTKTRTKTRTNRSQGAADAPAPAPRPEESPRPVPRSASSEVGFGGVTLGSPMDPKKLRKKTRGCETGDTYTIRGAGRKFGQETIQSTEVCVADGTVASIEVGLNHFRFHKADGCEGFFRLANTLEGLYGNRSYRQGEACDLYGNTTTCEAGWRVQGRSIQLECVYNHQYYTGSSYRRANTHTTLGMVDHQAMWRARSAENTKETDALRQQMLGD